MSLKRCLQTLTNKETDKVHKHLIKWLSEIIKKGKGSDTYALASRRYCLNYSKVYSDVTKRWLLAWNNKKKLHIACLIY